MDEEFMRVIKTAKSDVLRFSDAYGPNGLRSMKDSPCARLADLMSKESGPSGPWDDSDALMAGPVAGALLKASSDYLAGAIALVEGGQIGPPIAPVIRAMFEAMGRAAWLLDPDQDTGSEEDRYGNSRLGCVDADSGFERWNWPSGSVGSRMAPPMLSLAS